MGTIPYPAIVQEDGRKYIEIPELIDFLKKCNPHAYWMSGEQFLTKLIQHIENTPENMFSKPVS